MKELFVKNVVNETTDFLNNNQRIKQRIKLKEICIYYKMEKLEQSQKEEIQRNNEDILNRFISSKEIEGCSTRTLNYYRDNISKMLNTVNLPINEITTEILRNYLADYKSNSSAGMVTIDNIRRTLSSFFAWLENENYIVKSPVRRIHKVKTTRRVKETLTDENLEKLRDTCSKENYFGDGHYTVKEASRGYFDNTITRAKVKIVCSFYLFKNYTILYFFIIL